MAKGFNLTAQLNLVGPNNIKAVVSDIKRQLNGITANVNLNISANASRNLGQINSQLTTLNNNLRNTQNLATSTTRVLNNLGSAFANINRSSNNLPRNLNNIQSSALNANRNLGNLANTVKQTRTEFEDFGRQSALAIRRFAAFATVTSIFYRLNNAISSSLKEFITFDRELIRISQVTDTSVSNLKSLEKQISSLATQYGVSSSALIQVSTTLAQAGLSARDTEKALKALALSALAPSFDNLNDTVEGSIALMRQFGIGAGDLEKALGSVNAVAAKFAVEASDIITAIQRTGGVFATASRGVAEGTDALNQFIAVFTSVRATTRESAETIATGLRTIFTRIQRADTIEQLTKFGVVLTDLEGKFVGPYEAVRRLSEGLNKLDPRDLKFSQIVEELGGFRQIGKVIPLIQQFATAQQALKVAQQGQTSLTTDAANAQQALAIKMSKVTEEFNALIRSIAGSKGFRDLINLSLDLASAMISVADSLKNVLPALTAVMAIRGTSALLQFGRGFAGGLRRQNNGGPVRGFARGGIVPGVGNSDTVPAMLQPGEFVIRKNAVNAIGASNLHKINKYDGGGTVAKAKGSVLSKTYRSLANFVDPNETYQARIIHKNLASDDNSIIKRMIENKKKNQSLPMWKNFELALSSRFGLSMAGGNSFLDFPKKPGEAKFLKWGAGYSTDPETGFVRGNNELTMLAKLIGSGKYVKNKAVTVYYPNSPSGMASRVMTGVRSGQGIKRKAVGGGISGPDTVPALLTPGEFVINKKAANRIGSAKLHQMNNADRIQGFNKGGSVGGIQNFKNGGDVPPGIGSNLKQTAIKTSADIEAAIEKIMMTLEKAAKNAQDAAYKQARSEGKTAKESLDIGRQQATAVVNTMSGNSTYGKIAASRVVANMGGGTTSGNLSGSSVAMSQAGQQFAMSLKNATSPLQQLTQAAKSAGSGLASIVPKSVGTAARNFVNNGPGFMGAIGKGISKIGGGTINAIKSGGAMGSMALAMGGSLGVDALSKSFGGENTKEGRTVSAVGGSMANMASTGAAIGSLFGPIGTAVGAATGALAGYVIGLNEAEKANHEYAQSQRQATVEKAAEKSGGALSNFSSATGTGARMLAKEQFLGSFKQTSTAEAGLGRGVVPEKASWFGKMLGYEDESTVSVGAKRAETQKAGAQQAEQFLAQEMMNTGKTLAEVRASMKPEQFDMLARNIAEADQTYSNYVAGMERQIAAAKDPAEKARLESELNAQTAVMSQKIAARALAEEQAAAQAKKAADANAKLAETAIQVSQIMIANISNQFTKAGQAIDRSAAEMSAAMDNFNETITGVSSGIPNQLKKDIRVLRDPGANNAEKNAARSRAAAGLGAVGAQALQMANMGDKFKDIGLQAATRAVGKGGSTAEQNTNIANEVKNSLISQIVAIYGPDSEMARSLIAGVNASVNKMAAEAEKTGETLDANRLVDAAVGPINSAAQQAGELLIKQAENMAQGYSMLKQATDQVAQKKQEETNTTNQVNREIRATSRFLKEMRLTGKQRENLELTNQVFSSIEDALIDMGIGKADAEFRANQIMEQPVGDQGFAAKKQKLADLQNQQQAMVDLGVGPNDPRMIELSQKISDAETQIKQFKDNIEKLSQAIGNGITSIATAIDQRSQQLSKDFNDRLRAGENFAETLVTSTPQELMDLNHTWNILNGTLNGNITSFNQSIDAQQAYMQALQQGKTAQEAYSDAQTAFANRNKQALSLFNELTQIAGVKGTNLDFMKADLLEGFARSQGQGMENNPLFQQILSQLRMTEQERYDFAKANDPVVRVLDEILKQLQRNQQTVEAQRQNIVNADMAAANAAVPAAKATGGLVYASKGQYINFKPKGTDTVPAMLSQGEFVVNAKSTAKNLPLLQSINNGKIQTTENKALSTGGVVYLDDGGAVEKMANAQEEADFQDRKRAENVFGGGKKEGGTSIAVRQRYLNATVEQEAWDRGVHPNQVYNDREIFTYMQRFYPEWDLYRNQAMRGIMERRRRSFQVTQKDVNAMESGGKVDFDPEIDVEFVSRMHAQDAAGEAHDQLEKFMFPNPRIRVLARKYSGRLTPKQVWLNKSGYWGGDGPKRGGRWDPSKNRFFNSGGVVYANKGISVPYQPRGNDTVPAMLTPGEFVVNKESAQKHRGLLHKINNNALSSGGPVYANKGGLIYAADGIDVQNNARNANVSTQNGLITIKIISESAEKESTPRTNSEQGVLNSMAGMNNFIGKFDEFIGSLMSLQIPTTIEHSHSINVNLTGDANLISSLTSETGPLANWVVSKVDAKFQELDRRTEGGTR